MDKTSHQDEGATRSSSSESPKTNLRSRSTRSAGHAPEHAPPPEWPKHARGSAPHDFFRRFAHKTSTSMGSPWAFVLAVFVIMAWGITGPLFRFSDTWQLVINTSTTIVTFLMVFLIQNTQNRDAIALHIKIDELIRAVKGARNRLIDLEELTDEEIELLQEEFRKLGAGTPKTHPYPKER